MSSVQRHLQLAADSALEVSPSDTWESSAADGEFGVSLAARSRSGSTIAVGSTLPASQSADSPLRHFSTLSSRSWFSRLVFGWVAQLRAAGQARGYLELEDAEDLVGRDSTAFLSEWFERVWREEVTSVRSANRLARWKAWRSREVALQREPSLLRVLFGLFGWRFLSLGLLKLASDCLMFSGPVLLGYLVTFVASYDHSGADATPDSEPQPAWRGYSYASGLVLGVLLNAVASTQYNFAIRRVGLWVRAVMVTAVYRKSLLISNTARREFPSGRINNFLSVDTDRITDITISVHEFWSLPIQIGIALYLLYREVGLSLLAGLGIVVILIPVNAWLTARINSVSKAMMSFKDARLSLVDEAIRHIRTIKFLSLESRFARRILEARKLEMAQLALRKYFDALCVYLWATTPILVSLVTFSMYSWLLGHALTSAKVFTSLALFNILIRPLNAFPWVLNGLVEGRVSALRVFHFLKAPERGDEDEDEVEEVPAADWHTHLPAATTTTTTDAPVDDDRRTCTSRTHECMKCVICIEGSFDFVLERADHEHRPFAVQDPETSCVIAVNEPAPRTTDSTPPPQHALTNLSLHVYAGECIGVQGVVGSGKTTLLLGMLGELSLSRSGAQAGDGRSILGRVAYVSQEVWLPNATIRDAILFHSEYDASRYDAVLDACALRADLRTLASGDRTEIGEGGINLSGGQQMRIALARACYARADVVLLDDPLSSVDAHVGAHLVRRVLGRTGLLRDKTRVIVTHHTDLVRAHCDRMWTMERGRVAKEEKIEHEAPMTEATSAPAPLPALTEPVSATSSPDVLAASTTDANDDAEEEAERLALEKGFLTAEESRARGTIRSRVLRAYLAFIGWSLCGVILLSLVLMQASRNGADWWLSYWVDKATQAEHDGADLTAGDAHYYLRIFAYLAAGNSAAALFRAFIFAYGGLRAARRLFVTLLASILRAPVAFFDAHPVGRVLNRFSSDVYMVDESIPFQANIFLAQLFMFVGAIVVIATVVPAVLALLPFLAFAYHRIQAAYRGVSRELRRLDSTTRSPIYAHFSETLTGVAVIRAFGLESIFQSRNESILDRNQRVQFANLGMTNWLNLRLQAIGVCMITLVAFLAIVSCLYPVSWMRFLLNPAMVGLGIAYALPLTDTMNGIISSGTDTEKEVISVERTVEYIQVEPEDQHDLVREEEQEQTRERREQDATSHKASRKKKRRDATEEDLGTFLLAESPSESSSVPRSLPVTSEWPTHGTVCFDHVSLAYRASLEPALRDVSFNVRGGQRVGIVGRTGAGKSTLFHALFRMRDLSAGRILVDNIDITTVSRHQLRTRLAIIPQAPVLFSGSVRDNLLPYDEENATDRVPDEEIWRVLKECHMADKIQSMDQGLSTLLSESTRLSVGERQLLCFARALLKQSRVIVLDEATASVDHATSARIHELTLSLDATVLVIAHRLSSVQQLDTVLVMEDGRLVEMGAPSKLMQDAESRFARLARQASANTTNTPTIAARQE